MRPPMRDLDSAGLLNACVKCLEAPSYHHCTQCIVLLRHVHDE